MRLVRWGLALSLVALHLVMKAPVWALIARVDLPGLLRATTAIIWWTTASGISATGGFSDTSITTTGDGTCGISATSLLSVALTGGLVTLVFYIAIFIRSFGAIGTARKQVNGDRAQEWLLWCLGSALFATVVAHFGINYMAQIDDGLFPLLACISVATFEAKQATSSR